MLQGALSLRVAAAALLAALAWTGSAEAASGQRRGACAAPQVTSAYAGSVRRALQADRDVWGNELLRSSGGPTYDKAARYLHPLLLAAAPSRGKPKYLTDSGVYYLPFGWPAGGFGARVVALHVADGSEVLAGRVNGPNLTIRVGGERYGACLSRLATPQLYQGYLPVLETRYVDAAGVRYRQESFAGRIDETHGLVSFVRLTADASRSKRDVRIAFTPSAKHLRLSADRTALVRGPSTYMYVGPGAVYDGRTVSFLIPAGATGTVYVGWFVDPQASKPFVLDDDTYAAARQTVADFWNGRLQSAATFETPERRVNDAARSLLIQNAMLAWRYSVGNTYEELSNAEMMEVAQVMGAYGFQHVDEAILRTATWRKLSKSANWNMGERLLASARYYALFHDRAYLARHTPTLASYVARLGHRLAKNGHRLLPRERFSADIGVRVFGLHSQAVVWNGLREMAAVWSQTGHPGLAARARRIAAQLGAGLRSASRKQASRLKDGTLFVPVRLGDGERPYRRLTATRSGSYWNLVMPYALASGIFRPGSPEARGVLSYLLAHGSRILGLVRAGAYSLYGKSRFPVSGTDQVYGLNVSRFLADNDQPDQLVLSLYGQLAAGMTQGTFVSGEGATIAPIRGEYYRKMLLPPNAGSNSAFLETLRLMLVHETEGPLGMPNGLQLAFSTPRGWLRPGSRIAVTDAPTSFGPLTYQLTALDGEVDGLLEVPSSWRLEKLQLRLRLPAGRRLTAVLVDGRPYRRFDPRTGTIDLSGRRGTIQLTARFRPARDSAA
ncbi:MAG TPA: hypothetical protein VFA66_14610 [Gaiellaceae bacterium]|nr:hypothetical protein [Gaiellaceae bacterium]